MIDQNSNTAILLVYCIDRKGIIARITEFLNKNGGNIVYLEQHVDRQDKIFFMRIEWELEGFLIPKKEIAEHFGSHIAIKYDMTWRLYFSDQRPRMAIFVSKLTHCLFDILSRYQAGEWNVEIPLIISNHETIEPVANRFDIDFKYSPRSGDKKKEQEEKDILLLEKYKIDFVVLARYMQILSEDLLNKYPNKIINIHHSFLPAFPGAKPYHSAHAKGVKIIGATSHYVTTELDAGPIIEQDVTRISHTDSVQDLVRKGQDLEKIVLSRAVFAHLQRKTMVYQNRTIVFS